MALYKLMSYMMHFEVKSAGVADGVPMLVSSPQCSYVGLTVRTRRTGSPCCRLQRHKTHAKM